MAYGYKIRAADGKLVADVNTHCPLSWESSANAHLIAAAPELLAACRLALELCNQHPDSSRETRQVLQNAIEKATGRTHKNGDSVDSAGAFWKSGRSAGSRQ